MTTINTYLNDLCNILVDDDIDSKNNKQIKEIYENDNSLAIRVILKENKNYYLKIVNSFSLIADEEFSGLILDAINLSLQYDYKDLEDSNYTYLSGMILRNLLLERKRELKSDRKYLNNYDSISLDAIVLVGNVLESYEVSYKEIQLEDCINRSGISDIRKDILLTILNSRKKITQKEIGEQLGCSKQNINKHLKGISKELENLI